MPAEYKPSDAVVVAARGVGRVTAVDGERIAIRLGEGEVVVRVADAEGLVRRAVERPEARRFLERLCERCTEARSLPVLRSIRDLTRAPLDRQVEYARWYFRDKEALQPTEVPIVLAASEHVMAELALALGVADGDLRAAVKRGKPVVERRAQKTLPPAPTLEDCEHLRSFWLGTEAVVGEWPEQERGVLRVAVAPGAWHAYVVEKSDDEGDDRTGLLLRHTDLRNDVPWDCAEIDVGGVNVEGGAIGIIDATALVDVEFGVDEVERLRRDGEAYGDRGIETSTFGDGDHRVLVDRKDAAMSLYLPF